MIILLRTRDYAEEHLTVMEPFRYASRRNLKGRGEQLWGASGRKQVVGCSYPYIYIYLYMLNL